MNRRRAATAIAAALITASGVGALAVDDPARAESCSRGTVSRLYLGQSTPSGAVGESEWRQFVDELVAPRFPSGFTELRGQGRWRSARGDVVEESTRIVEVVHEDSAGSRARVRAIAADYRNRFAQESVLIAHSPSVHCF